MQISADQGQFVVLLIKLLVGARRTIKIGAFTG